MSLGLDDSERVMLHEALTELSNGRTRAFMDRMWLGFGDRWVPVLRSLAKQHAVTLPGGDPARCSMGASGRELIERLEGLPNGAAGTGSAEGGSLQVIPIRIGACAGRGPGLERAVSAPERSSSRHSL